MELMDGVKYRNELLEEYKKTIESESLKIKLVIIQVGDNPVSNGYVNNKIKYSKQIGIEPVLYKFPETTTEELLELVKKLNEDDSVTGIILQSPAEGIDFDLVAGSIDPRKDVDGFTTENVSALYYGTEALIPCTVRGIIRILEHYKIDLDGKKVTIVGRGNIVGKPLSLALTNRNATVTLCHSHTKNLGECTKTADIVVAAVGKPGLIKGDMIKDGVILVDVGMSKIDGVWFGDIDRESVEEKASLLTPVPGGVGPMTIAMIMENLIIAKKEM